RAGHRGSNRYRPGARRCGRARAAPAERQKRLRRGAQALDAPGLRARPADGSGGAAHGTARARARGKSPHAAPRGAGAAGRRQGGGKRTLRALECFTAMPKAKQLQRARGEDAAAAPLDAAFKLVDALPVPVFFKSRDGRYLGVNRAWEEFFGVAGDSFVGKQVTDLYPNDPAIADSANEGILVYDRDLNIVAGNQAAERILGIPLAELIGIAGFTSLLACVHADGRALRPDDRPTRLTVRTGKPLSGHVLGIKRPGGAHTWLLVNTGFLRHPQASDWYGVVSSFPDITGQRNAESALRASEERYRRTFELAGSGLAQVGLDG